MFSAIAAGIALQFSPIYRGLTFQFKVYAPLPHQTTAMHTDSLPSFLQMSGMTIGSMIEADKRLRVHEVAMRKHKQLARDAAIWERYQQEYLGKSSEDIDNTK